MFDFVAYVAGGHHCSVDDERQASHARTGAGH